MSEKSRFSGEKMDAIVKELSFPRLPGSEGDPKGVEYCKNLFGEIDLKLGEEEVLATDFWVGWGMQLIGFTIIAIVSGLFYFFIMIPWVNLIAISLLIVMILSTIPKILGSGELKIIGEPIKTKNLIGKIPAKGTSTKTIIISGHHDTKSQTITTIFRAIAYAILGMGAALMLLVFFIGGLLGIIILLIPGFTIPLGYQILGLVTYIITLCGAIPISFNRLGNKSPGSTDNASSVAVLYELAKVINKNPLENTQIIVAIFGAEEVGMLGARAWVKKHFDEYPVDSTYNINIDMVGYRGANVQMMEYEGAPKKRRVSQFLCDLAYEVAKEKGIDLHGFWMPTGAATDRNVFTSKGYDGMDFAVMKAAMHTHRKNDSPDKFDGNLCVKTVEIIMGMIESINSMN
ncbi:MAG: Zn-dependent exopeptidase M28 [archaeon]|nr:Zn-dependent exopeptidase M28 [archaeon]